MLILNRFYFVVLCTVLISCKAQIPEAYLPIVQNSTQLILVTAADSASSGELHFFERSTTQKAWKEKFSFQISIGRNGFATDSAFDPNAKKIKKEGDGCSPAGAYTLGPVFSYHNMENLHMPFQQVSKKHLCIDDMQSAYYNRLVYADTIQKTDWNSFEYMQRNDLQYEYGIWVNYNTENSIPGNGSCIFLHVWSDENVPTSGCTAMRKEDMLQLIYALDEKRNPILIQFAE